MTERATAFLADQIDELQFLPLLNGDCTAGVSLAEGGLRFEVSVGRETLVSIFDGQTWVPVEEDEDGATEFGLWTPLVPHDFRNLDVTDDDLVDEQLFRTYEENADLANWVATLVAAGWRVSVRHTGDGAVAEVHVAASAPDVDEGRAGVACHALRLPSGISEIEAVWVRHSGLDSWGFQDEAEVAAGNGERQRVPIDRLLTYVIACAPSWCLAPGLDSPVDRRAGGHDMKSSIVAEIWKPTTRSHHEIRNCRAAVAKWSEDHGFSEPLEPALPQKVQRFLDDLNEGNTGYYLLEFDNGDCYLGQSKSIADRLKGHRVNRSDIRSIRVKPDSVARTLTDPLRHLLENEATLINSIQLARLPARNKAQMTYISEQRSLDEIFKDCETTVADWLSRPAQVNRTFDADGRTVPLEPSQRAPWETSYELWCERTGDDADTVRSLYRTYMELCLPLPRRTEYAYWVLSAPEKIPYFRSISNLTIGFTEAFRLMMDTDGSLSGMVQVNGVELLGEEMSDTALVRFMRQHPGVSVTEAPYQASGPFNLLVWAPNLQSLVDLFQDATFLRSAATAAIHLMRASRAGNIRTAHNPILVDAILSDQS
ncbi:GIY-YIG nuclease family protein [Gordonia paraffinivorans]|uniref:GIY-YIG nuclease family protein n=1 Tax=Gordonia paraffinivorans TaxID=175628 RepID=UPI0012F7CC7A|nr:GIY-YIG nuclease family protein [Gordonia paraffinivorans]